MRCGDTIVFCSLLVHHGVFLHGEGGVRDLYAWYACARAWTRWHEEIGKMRIEPMFYPFC